MLELILYKLKTYLSLATCTLMPAFACASSTSPPAEFKLHLPPGFSATIFAKLNEPPRMLAFDADGQLYATSAKSNQVLMLPDHNQDGIAETPVLISDQLNAPNGLAFVDGDLLIANQDGVVKLSKKNGAWSSPQPFISGLPIGGHTLKTIKLSPDDHLFINVGSSCNVCLEDDASRATLLRYTKTGKPAGAIPVLGQHTNLAPIWASGLRNAQGFAWQPTTGDMYATNDGADMRSASKNGPIDDALPPEHFNKISAGNHYGWPHCWGNSSEPNMMDADPNFLGGPDFCAKASPPAILFPSHATPIGVTFLQQSHFPADYQQDAIVALHGSWNRQQLSGYKLVRVKFNAGKPIAVVDFATGWLQNNAAWGRPVDVITGPDGALYVSDDRANYIYRISYQP